MATMLPSIICHLPSMNIDGKRDIFYPMPLRQSSPRQYKES